MTAPLFHVEACPHCAGPPSFERQPAGRWWGRCHAMRDCTLIALGGSVEEAIGNWNAACKQGGEEDGE